jgi:SAM-dependent methyltransferase
MIVVDDGSTDDTMEVLRRYEDSICLLRQQNQGCVAARQRGVEYAHGEYLAFLDQDDWWTPEKLAIQVNILQKNPNIGLSFGNLEAVDDESRSRGFMVAPPQCCHSPSWEEMLLMFPVYPSSTLLRKSLFQQVGGFDFRFGLSGAYGDQDFHLRLREVTNFHFSKRKLGYYYWNEDRLGRALSFLTNLPVYAEKYNNHVRFSNPRGAIIRQRLIKKCADEMSYHSRHILRQSENIVTSQLLDQINCAHARLKTIFGYDYLKISGMDSLDLSKFPKEGGIMALLFVYLCRSDLQRNFPEVSRGDIGRLLNWAFKTSNGTHKDMDSAILRPFRASFKEGTRASTTGKTRLDLAASLEGRGIEIGALNSPLPAPKAREILYVDVMDSKQLKQSYPVPGDIIKTDILSDGEHLAIRDSSIDFIIANHVLEHLANPLKALHDWVRCLKPNGKLLLAIPDKRFTFDRARTNTTIRHLMQDFQAKCDERSLVQTHAEEWVEKIDNLNPGTEAFKAKVRQVLDNHSVMHKHVWTDSDFMVLLDFLTKFHLPLVLLQFVEATSQSREFLCLLEKVSLMPNEKIFLNLSSEHNLIVESYDLISEARRKARIYDDLIQQLHSDILELSAIKRSFGYRLIRFYSTAIDTFFPYGTHRGNFKRLVVLSLQVIAQEGLKTWFRQAMDKIKRRDFTISSID